MFPLSPTILVLCILISSLSSNSTVEVEISPVRT